MHCSICKQEFKEYELNRIFTGRPHYICDKCLKEGRNDAEYVRLRAVEHIRKERSK